MTTKAENEEIEALREEARYWQREALKARERADEAAKRARDIAVPSVTVIRGETWWRVYVNGERIDGHETEETANTVADRLRKAFTMTGK